MPHTFPNVQPFSSRLSVIFAAIAALTCSLPAHAEDEAPLKLEPSSKWRLDYSDDSCRLARTFGEGDNTTAFVMERYGPGDEFYMIVAGEPLGKLERGKTDIAFGPNGETREDETTYGDFGTFGSAVMVTGMSILPLSEEDRNSKRYQFEPEKIAQNTDVFGQRLSAEQEKQIHWLDVKPPAQKPIRLKTGSMGPPLAALRKCTDGLLSHWGLDVDEMRSMTRAPVPTKSPGAWIKASDYPAQAVRKGHQGIIAFRLMVGPDGKPESCHIQQGTKPEGFQTLVCDKLMQRARFEPALGNGGKPIRSFYQNTVRFQIGR